MSLMQMHGLFDQMLALGASDLHLSTQYPPMVRVRGDLVVLPCDGGFTDATLRAWLYALIPLPQRQAFEREHDLDFAYGYADKARFRGNYLEKVQGIAAVFRIIPTRIQSMADLRLPDALGKLTEAKAGLILVTGPTGSGKSTTLAAMLDRINQTRSGHILTIEDPVEFVHSAKRCQISHREVGRDTPDFADAIRSAGREDCDVILVGELRGAATMRLALQAASSGVLVFATVHTNSAAATIDRVINAFSAEQQPAIRGMLAECLTGIVAQQLLKKADGQGRLAVQEILLGNRAVSSIVREGKVMMLSSLMQSSRAEGMQTMDAVLENLARDGTITVAEALSKAIDKENFAKLPFVADGLELHV